MNKSILSVNNLNYSIENTEILKNITFDIYKGDFVGIIGPNGAGKSTLIKIILNEIENYSGKIFFEDKIGYVPQKEEFDRTFPIKTIELILLGLYRQKGIFKRFSKEEVKKAESLMEKLEITKLKNVNVGKVSGGEFQRIILARALISDPNILILDEPEAGVDKSGQSLYYKLLKDLNEKENKTIILISHDLSMVMKEANKIMCLNKTLHCHKKTEEMTSSDLKGIYSESLEILFHIEDKVKVVRKND
jgi:zinc transport system ATP-binding protein